MERTLRYLSYAALVGVGGFLLMLGLFYGD